MEETEMTTATATRPATEKQISFIKSLIAERDVSELELNRYRTLVREQGTKGASRVIDLLKATPRKIGQEPVTVAPEGMHKVGDRIFKVQRAVHGSGNLYAKELVQAGPDAFEDGFKFEYSPGIIRILNDSTLMTIEEAKRFGALYGTCCVCGRTLTDENSIAEGIGPVCAKKF